MDKRVEDFMSVEPEMFENTDERAQQIETASRLINWIAFLIRSVTVLWLCVRWCSSSTHWFVVTATQCAPHLTHIV